MKLKRSAENLSLILGGVFIGLLLVEGGLRIFGVSYPIFYTPDRDRGWALPAGASGWFREEGESFVRINSDGLIDREHAKAKPRNTVRIAVLGDSFTEAMQVPRETNYCSVLERGLPGCKALGGRNVEVINFGVGGYGTAQELLTLRHHVWDYAPDIVVLAVCWGNDVMENSHALDRFSYRPYFVYRNNRLVLDSSFRDSASYHLHATIWQLIPDSRVIQVVKRVKDSIIQSHQRALNQEKFPHLSQFRDFTRPEYAMLFREPTDPAWQEAWRVTEGLLVCVRDEVKGNGADLLVVTLDSHNQVFPDPLVRREFMKAYGTQDLFYPNLRIKALCEREGIKFLDLGQPFQDYADAHRVFLHGFKNTPKGYGHWNIEGHRLAGKLIAQKLCAEAKF